MKIIDRLRARSSLSRDEEVNGGLCPRAVTGIEAWVLYEKPKNTVYCMGSIEQDKYIAVPESKVAFLLADSNGFCGVGLLSTPGLDF